MELGVDVFLKEHVEQYTDKRIGLLTNMTGVNHRLESTMELFYDHPKLHLTALFAPEHGIFGERREGETISSSTDHERGLPIYSLYGPVKTPDASMLEEVDVVFCDLQDIGTRYYTFIYSVANMLKACGQLGKQAVILDRPNPINGVNIEGNILDKQFRSFVGQYPIIVRHGMTIGELASFLNSEFNLGCDLEVIPMQGWRRNMYFDDTDLFWVPPTPNTTSIDMCLLYPGTCLFEGTNISEGRGTTKPFEVIGAPFINGKDLAKELHQKQINGVEFRYTIFKPMYQKHAGKLCEGVQIHITDRSQLEAFTLGLQVLQTIHNMYASQINYVRSPDFDNHFFLDLLAGTDQLRKQLNTGDITEFISRLPEDTKQFGEKRKKYLLYDWK